MPVPFNAPRRNYLQNRQEIDAAVARVLDSGCYIFGEEVQNFEQAFAAYCGVSHCIGVASGTEAMLIALRAANVVVGSEVITVGNAGGYSSICCLQIGAIPVYVDVRPDTLVMDTDEVTAAITDQTRVIIATHLFGNMVHMAPLQNLATQHGILLIEDCAQAHGAVRDGSRAGSSGDIGVFSFYPTKNLGALGDGGALICSNEELATTIRELRQYGWRNKYVVNRPYGVNSRLDPIQAAVLSVKLPHLDAANRRRRQIVEHYMGALGHDDLKFCHQLDASYAGHLCVVQHTERDSIRGELARVEIGTEVHYPILDFDQPGFRKFDLRKHPVPVSKKACASIFSLPLFPELTDDEVNEVAVALSRCLDRH